MKCSQLSDSVSQLRNFFQKVSHTASPRPLIGKPHLWFPSQTAPRGVQIHPSGAFYRQRHFGVCGHRPPFRGRCKHAKRVCPSFLRKLCSAETFLTTTQSKEVSRRNYYPIKNCVEAFEWCGKLCPKSFPQKTKNKKTTEVLRPRF